MVWGMGWGFTCYTEKEECDEADSLDAIWNFDEDHKKFEELEVKSDGEEDCCGVKKTCDSYDLIGVLEFAEEEEGAEAPSDSKVGSVADCVVKGEFGRNGAANVFVVIVHDTVDGDEDDEAKLEEEEEDDEVVMVYGKEPMQKKYKSKTDGVWIE